MKRIAFLFLGGMVLIVFGFLFIDSDRVSPATPPGAAPNLLMLGLDSMNWSILLPLIRMGQMPVIERLMAHGAKADLQTLKPTLSDVIWTSVLTGKLPAHHGITAVILPDPDSGQLIPVSSNLRRAAALWNILDGEHLSHSFFKWLVTWPAEHTLGVQISQRFGFPALEGRAYPKAFETVMAPTRAAVWQGADFSPAVILGQDRELRYHMATLAEWARDDQQTYEQAWYCGERLHPRVLAAYFLGLDRIQHHFFGFTVGDSPVRSSWHEARRVIPDYYRYYDRIAGRLLASAAYDHVVALSDHGMQLADDPNKFMIREQSPRQDAHSMVKQVSLNLVLQQLDLLQQNEQGVIDWSRTTAFVNEGDADPGERSVQLNVMGEQPFGIIERNEADARTQTVQATLQAVKTSGSGKPLFTSITATPVGHELVCSLNPEIGNQAILSLADREIALRDLIEPQIAGSGEHHHAPPGILLLSGPSFLPGNTTKASVIDVCPTILQLLNIAAAHDMDGQTLTAAFTPEFLAAHPPRFVKSYDHLVTFTHAPVRSSADEQLEEIMRRLGYIK